MARTWPERRVGWVSALEWFKGGVQSGWRAAQRKTLQVHFASAWPLDVCVADATRGGWG